MVYWLLLFYVPVLLNLLFAVYMKILKTELNKSNNTAF